MGKSTVGSGGDLKVYGRNLPVTIRGVQVEPVSLRSHPQDLISHHQGDIVFCDSVEGIVVIPKTLLDDTLSLMQKLVPADDKVKEAVAKGMPVAEAFRKFRG